jgi:hypothetical protein
MTHIVIKEIELDEIKLDSNEHVLGKYIRTVGESPKFPHRIASDGHVRHLTQAGSQDGLKNDQKRQNHQQLQVPFQVHEGIVSDHSDHNHYSSSGKEAKGPMINTVDSAETDDRTSWVT